MFQTDNILITPDLLLLISEIDEFKGGREICHRQAAYLQARQTRLP